MTRAILVVVITTALVVVNAIAWWPSSVSEGHGLFSMVRPAYAREGSPFPAGNAGLTAYLNLGSKDFKTLNDAAIAAAGTTGEVEGTDGNGFIWVSIPISGKAGEASWTDTVNLYADINGWVAAFLPRGIGASVLVQWENEACEAKTTVRDLNVLEEALQTMLTPMSENFSALRDSIDYYHFAYPSADGLWIAAKYNGGFLSFVVPENLAIAEASVSLVSCGRGTEFFLAGKSIKSFRSARQISDASLASGSSYKLELTETLGSSAAIVIVTGSR